MSVLSFVRRRPETRAQDKLGEHFAEAAYRELASVYTYDRLAQGLQEQGAPASLVTAARRAGQDKVRSARRLSRLCRCHGGTPRQPAIEPVRSRPLELIARDAAVEGCIKARFAGMLAQHQVEHASESNVRAVMRAIASDSLRHVALARRVVGWSTHRLGSAEQGRIQLEQGHALQALAARWTRPLDPEVRARVGLPDASVARQMVDKVLRELWELPGGP